MRGLTDGSIIPGLNLNMFNHLIHCFTVYPIMTPEHWFAEMQRKRTIPTTPTCRINVSNDLEEADKVHHAQFYITLRQIALAA